MIKKIESNSSKENLRLHELALDLCEALSILLLNFFENSDNFFYFHSFIKMN
jgi:hypothetical protein